MNKYTAVSQVRHVHLGDVTSDQDEQPNSTDGGKKKRNRSQAAFLMMTVPFFLGVGTAIAHDRFYAHFHHHTTGTDREQRIIHVAGTAFAFVTKMLLGLAAATAYTQHFWLRASQRPATVAQIDTMTSVLSNAFLFAELGVWTRHGMLGLVAVIVWFLPFAAVFTPGTIVVQPHQQYGLLLATPPQAQRSWIGVQNYAAAKIDVTATTCHRSGNCYENVVLQSPSTELSRVTHMAAFQQSMIVPTPISPRMSYSLTFFGPSLSCSSTSDAEKATFNDSLTEAYEDWSIWAARQLENSIDEATYRMLYNAWSATVTTIPGGNLSDPIWNNDTVIYKPGTKNVEHFYLRKSNAAEAMSMVLLRCSLHNASYTVDY